MKPTDMGKLENSKPSIESSLGGMPALVVNKYDVTVRHEMYEKMLSELEALSSTVNTQRLKLEALADKFYVNTTGSSLGGVYEIAFNKDNSTKPHDELSKLIYNKFVSTYGLNLESIVTEISKMRKRFIEAKLALFKKIEGGYCEVDLFKDKIEAVEC